MQKIFALIDLQNDFILPTGKLTVNAPELIQKTQDFIEQTQGLFNQIFITQDTHYRHTYAQTPEAQFYPPHCLYGTKGWKIPLRFNHPIHVILKAQPDVWQKKNTPLHRLSYQNTTVYLAGVCADICVEHAMQGFLARGARVRLLTDLTKGYTYSAEEVLQKQTYKWLVQKGRLKGITMRAFLKEQHIQFRG